MSAATFTDFNLLHGFHGLGPVEVDHQHAIGKISARHLYPFGQNKSLLELPGSDAAMQENPVFVISLAAFDNQLIVFDGNVQIIPTEPGNGQCDPQMIFGNLFNIIGRIAIIGPFGRPVDHPFQMVKAQQKRAVQQ